MTKDLLSGVALLGISGTYYAWSTYIADSTLSDEVGAGGLPRALAVVLAILGVILIARTLLIARAAAPANAAASDDDEEQASLPRGIGFLLIGAAYIFLLPFVGYILATALMIAAVALYEGAARTWAIPAAALGGGVFYWAIFVKLLGVHQPMGSIFQGLF
ncbi:tripartite tricarboxylate transporter TctB family protein [Rhizobium sp. TH2]|uniref:tripartite tricarboxylate transporter TctB family protein n=1 Tax=Rhizobium sp. TH2 TaxID=2775403 RepID=UPI002157769D|nr:tripartite tricarboxylate transporter TctB family protein [Rhizobium sp. TH2]UVC08634.1 tripartite tricarboxylate transporter TctB family protein [Rhizobium sp. TH2]